MNHYFLLDNELYGKILAYLEEKTKIFEKTDEEIKTEAEK